MPTFPTARASATPGRGSARSPISGDPGTANTSPTGNSVPGDPLTITPLFTPPELTAQLWAGAAARLLAKLLGEFAYEEIIEPVAGAGANGEAADHYTLALDDGTPSPSPPDAAPTAAGASTPTPSNTRDSPSGTPSASSSSRATPSRSTAPPSAISSAN